MGKIKVPSDGKSITFKGKTIHVPDNPIIPFIQGDGVGIDIWPAAVRVFDAAVDSVFGGDRKVSWMEIYAGEKAKKIYGEWLPEETLQAIRDYKVAIKGPLTTPIGGGLRSLNVTLRQVLDLYACVRPISYFRGVPSPLRHPEEVDFVIFRENTEDVYAGIEWPSGSTESKKIIQFLNKELKCQISETSGIGIKPMSPENSKRLVRKALRYAIDQQRPSVTLVHKGNIMKYTEGSFRDWGYELARTEFSDVVVTEEEITTKYGGQKPEGKILLNDRIADNMFQQILLRPSEYSVLATPNLNGDYLSDAALAQVGGLGLGPGANIGDETALFEATHGTAPKYAGQDKVNPGSLILSGVMMFEHMEWKAVSDVIITAMQKTFLQKKVTYDLARHMEKAKELRCSEWAAAIIGNMS